MRITKKQWQVLLRAARDLDLNKGGYCDGRLGCINFWCGPENKPKGYDYPITKGALKYPRNFLGVVHPDWDRSSDEDIILVFEICNYAARDAIEKEGMWAFSSYSAYKEACQRAFEGTAEDKEWLRQEFQHLYKYAFGYITA